MLNLNYRNKTAEIVLVLIVICLFFPMAYYKGNQVGILSDFDGHNQIIRNILENGEIITPHFLFHVLTSLTYFAIFKYKIELASILVITVCYVFLALILYRVIKQLFTESLQLKHELLIMSITVGVMLASPIALLAFIDNHLYFGYVALNVYHNPTMTLLKPIAVVHFILTAQIYSSKKVEPKTIIMLAVLTVLAALAKPNYLVCLLPTVILATVCQLQRNRKINYSLLSFGIIVPALIILSWQYSLTYGGSQFSATETKIIIAPFVVMKANSSMLWWKYLLSIAFPLCVSVCYWNRVKQNIYFMLAWLLFLFGSIQTYFLAESGRRMLDGNFGWSGQLSIFILFIISSMHFIQQNEQFFVFSDFSAAARYPSKGFLVCSVIFILHIVTGIFWYCCNFLGPRYLW